MMLLSNLTNTLDVPVESMNCSELMGGNLMSVFGVFIDAIRIIGAILGIIYGMMAIIPAITSKDADALNKALKKCVKIAIILCVIGIFPSLVSVIGKIGGFDTTCL